jgi:hypothetical protein
MSKRDDLRKIAADLPFTPTPVVIAGEPVKKMQVALLQIAKGEVGTIICNGVLYAWRNK